MMETLTGEFVLSHLRAQSKARRWGTEDFLSLIPET